MEPDAGSLWGDLNEEPLSASLQAMYNDYWEAEPRYSKRYTYYWNVLKTIDYLFNSSQHTNRGSSAYLRYSGASDHYIYAGFFNWTTGCP